MGASVEDMRDRTQKTNRLTGAVIALCLVALIIASAIVTRG